MYYHLCSYNFLFIDDDCYDTLYDDTDPFQDDNNNNYTTSVSTNDPEQFEYFVSTLNEIKVRLEPSNLSSTVSYIGLFFCRMKKIDF